MNQHFFPTTLWYASLFYNDDSHQTCTTPIFLHQTPQTEMISTKFPKKERPLIKNFRSSPDKTYIFILFYYESRYVCRCDERLKTKVEESTCLGYTGFLGELEHLKIEVRLIDEMLSSVMGEYVFLK